MQHNTIVKFRITIFTLCWKINVCRLLRKNGNKKYLGLKCQCKKFSSEITRKEEQFIKSHQLSFKSSK